MNLKLIIYLVATAIYIPALIKQISIIRTSVKTDNNKFTKYSFMTYSICVMTLAWVAYFKWDTVIGGVLYFILAIIVFHLYIIKNPT